MIIWWQMQPLWMCYLVVILLMAMESSIFPVPSEVVIPPAAIMAVTQGHMSILGVVLAGTFGSWLGSAITYGVSRSVGRPLVLRYGKYFFMPPHKVERAEFFLQRYQNGGIFFARLLPVVRHLISIPAGMIRMNFVIFSVLTITGAFIWCGILALYGNKIGKDNPHMLDTPKELVAAIKNESLGIIIIVAILCALYFLMIKLSSRKPGNPGKEKVAEEGE